MWLLQVPGVFTAGAAFLRGRAAAARGALCHGLRSFPWENHGKILDIPWMSDDVG